VDASATGKWSRYCLISAAALVCLSLGAARAEDAPWQVGLARVRITPDGPMPMCGYGPRISDGVLDDLCAKAMAIESSAEKEKGTGTFCAQHPLGPSGKMLLSPFPNRAVLVTADLLFFRRDVAEAVAKRIMEKTGLSRRQILLNASHTHSGPVVGMNGDLDSFAVPADQRPRVAAYTRRLQEQLGDLAAAALGDMRPARLSFGTGRVDFVMNRRLRTKDGVVMAPNPQGPADRSVPVLRVDGPDGRLRALVFGCACHPVTLGGDNKKISGDYAGLAQAALEQRHPGAQAMFVIGCGGDANSHPRGTAGLARQQADQLAAEVSRAIAAPMRHVRGPLRAELAWIGLPLEHDFSRGQLAAMAAGPSIWHGRNAKGLLEILASGKPLPRAYRAPLAVWQFGDDLTLVALSGEAVSQYAARIAQALGPEGLWVAAYANESFGYLPTPQILKEGGHESMCLTLDIGLFSPQVEDVVLAEVQKLAQKAGRNKGAARADFRSLQDFGSLSRGHRPTDLAGVVFPEDHWLEITPAEAGLDVKKFDAILQRAKIHGGGFGGVKVADGQWGAVLTRGGYLVRRWGNPSYRYQSASLGKCIVRALFGLSVEAGVLKPDEPIWKTWTGRGQLSHPHKYLDEGFHRQLTWRQLLDHRGGFVLESGFHWRRRTMFHAVIPPGVTWTGDPLFDNFAQTPPGSTTRYSSGGYWRLGQALTALWGKDLKEVLDERLFRHLGIPADRWEWTPGKEVHDTRDFYPDFPGYGEYVDPPYEINGHVVRGAAGWMRISAEDLARFGLLIATGGVWKGKRLIGAEWLRGHAGLDIHVVAGDPDTMVAIAKINTKDFPFGAEVATQGKLSFPRDLITGPVRVKVKK
jgi:CubicO group peptidase (beta-lactamase class C family)